MEIAVCSWSYRLSAERVAEEMEKGDVNADAFIAALREIGYDGCLAVEREAGDDRPGDIARAVMDLHRRGF